MDPLIVMYQDGYVRYGYRESDMAKTTKDRLESTLSEFEEMVLLPFVKKDSQLRRYIQNPLNHIQNQMKDAVATFVDTFKDQAFQVGNPLGAEDGFEYYAMDFILDDNLDVWMVKAYNETKLPGKGSSAETTAIFSLNLIVLIFLLCRG
jgi:hypothetical protein